MIDIQERVFQTSEGRFHAVFSIDDQRTPAVCDVCLDVRHAAFTVMFHLQMISGGIESAEQVPWMEFEKTHAAAASEISVQLSARGFNKPVCFECQQDYFLSGVHRYKA